jgi:hypothetical protein
MLFMAAPEELVQRAHEFARRRGLIVRDVLGYGIHGSVYATESQPYPNRAMAKSAIKLYRRFADYERERDVYFRLAEYGVDEVRGCHVPCLLAHDEELLAIEMTLVTPPYLLVFAGAYLDHAPTFSDEVMDEWHAEKAEHFGARWRDVLAILEIFEEKYGIIIQDINPGNINFGD